jgi:hypothetical protein
MKYRVHRYLLEVRDLFDVVLPRKSDGSGGSTQPPKGAGTPRILALSERRCKSMFLCPYLGISPIEGDTAYGRIPFAVLEAQR